MSTVPARPRRPPAQGEPAQRRLTALARCSPAGALLLLGGCMLATTGAGTVTGPCVTHQVVNQGALCDGQGRRVDVTVRNFRIDLPAVIPTGEVTFVIHGAGPTLHEFNVAKSVLDPRHLMLAANDTVADGTNTAQFTWIAQVEGIDVGDTATLTTNITPGHYVFYCNMDGHYMAGMSAQAVAE